MRNVYINFILLVAIAVTCAPSRVFAGLEITEVMYSPDKGGEWVEIYNNGDSAVDLKGYKLFDGVNHTVSASSVVLPAGGYIILANDKSELVSAFNTITAPVLDIVTSFNNDGDTITLRNASNVDLATMSYTSTAGADKNGKTLQKIDGEFLPFRPASPGEPAQVTKNDVDEQVAAENVGQAVTNQNTTNTTSNLTSPYHAWPSDMSLYVSAGGDRLTLAGARTRFEGRVLSASKKPLPNADLIWTFGDGGSDRGTTVFHTFHYPGKYVVILDVISGDYIQKDQIMVDVVPPKLAIKNVTTGDNAYIEVKNETIYNLDIGEYVLEAGGLSGTHFKLPKNTIILAGKSIIFPSKITKLQNNTTNVSLKFPDGDSVTTYSETGGMNYEVASEATPVLENEGVTEKEDKQSIKVTDVVNLAQEFVSRNILPSVFVPDDEVKKDESLPVMETQENIFSATPTSQAAAGSASNEINGRLAVGAIILGAVLFVYTLRRFDKHADKDNLEEEAETIEIIH